MGHPGADKDIQVVFDRRQGERRQRLQAVDQERRQEERRDPLSSVVPEVDSFLGEGTCVFRAIPAADSGRCRPPVPAQAGHRGSV